MRYKAALFIFILLLSAVATTSGAAQETPYQNMAQIALAVTNDQCAGLGRNQACYGHARLTAEPQSGIGTFQFDAEGDRTSLSSIQSIKLSGLDTESGIWGVALMQLRANLPSAKPDNVTLVAFGDVEMRNAILPPTAADIQVRARQNVNVRVTPTTQAGVIGTIAPGQTVTAVERLADTSWLRVNLPDSDLTGWVFTDLITAPTDLEALNVSVSNSVYYEPMQAYYFRNGLDDSALASIPENGLLIQTPEGVGEVQLLINEINIQLGSTVYFEAHPGGMMAVSTLEGHANVTAQGVTQTAFAGTTVTVALDENLAPTGAPTPPVPYDADFMNALPLGLLPMTITVSPPRTLVEIQELVQQQEEQVMAALGSVNPNADDASGSCCLAGETPETGCTGPGESCNAPGQGGECPGNSCDNPGQGEGRAQNNDKTDKKNK